MIEDLIREALDAEVARNVPHNRARAENLRRIARDRRRRHFTRPVMAVAAAAAATSVGVLLVQLPKLDGKPQPDLAPAALGAPLPDDLDPRYRPTGPVMDAGDGLSTWLSGQQVCWRLRAGGGACSPSRLVGAHIGIASTRQRPVKIDPMMEQSPITVYGVADTQVSGVRLETHTFTIPGQVLDRPGARQRIWQISYPETQVFSMPPELESLPQQEVLKRYKQPTLVFTGADGKTISSVPFGPRLGMTIPYPLTTGVPLFTYQNKAGQDVNVRAYRDGTMMGFTSTDDDTNGNATVDGPTKASFTGKGRYFGGVHSAGKEGPDSPWWYGYMSPNMTRVVAELNDGRKLETKITTIYGQRIFYVQLEGVEPGRKTNSTGILVSYDATGKRLATWKI